MPPGAVLQRAEADRDRLLKGELRTFDVLSRGLKAFIAKDASGADQRYIEAIASSSVVDRMGDQITLACLEGLKMQTAGMTVWLNHDYEVPESIFGTIVESRIVPATDAGIPGGLEAQGQVYDLIIKTLVAPDNPRAINTWQHIQNGRRLAQSIGGAIIDYDFLDPDELWWGGLEINGMDLWEISVVGVPANQRAYVEGKSVQPVAFGLRKSLNKPYDLATRRSMKKDAAADAGGGENAGDGESSGDVPATEAPAQSPPPDDTAPAAAPDSGGETPPPAPADGAVPGYCSVSLEIRGAKDAVNVDDVVELVSKWFVADVQLCKDGAEDLGDDSIAQVRAAHKCIQDAMNHGVCGAGDELLKAASDTLESLLPDGSGAQAEINGDDSPAEYASVRGDIAALETQRGELLTECGTLMQMVKALLDQRDALLDVIAGLNATPLSRATKPFASTLERSGNGAPDPSRRRMSVAQIMAFHTQNRGADARARSLTA